LPSVRMGPVTDTARVEIRLLGRFAALRGGDEIPPSAFAGKKVRTLIKVLASRQGRFVSNDVLADAVWPERLPADPVANLQVLVNRARNALGVRNLILTGQGGYTLVAGSECEVDAERFLVLSESESDADLREALALWRGDPLPEEAYDEWTVEVRTRLTRARQRVLEQVAANALDDGNVDEAVEIASRAVEAEPLREASVLLLVRALAAAGDGAGALAAYDGYRRALADELGVDPSAEAAALHQQLLERLPARRQGPVRRRAGTFAELPFVGRDRELELVRATLATGARRGSVVVVSGVSGSGKSRFVETVARDMPMVRARAFLSEVAEPLSLLRSLLREVVALDIGYVDSLPAPMAAALAWILPELGDGEAAAPDPESRRILLQEVALRLVDAAGVVIAVDDLQWCDPSSLAALESVIRRGHGPGTVLAYRTEEASDRDEVAGFLGRCDVAVHVSLHGLSEDSLRQITDDAGIVDAICAHTDRTPMAVSEVLRGLTAGGLVEVSANGRVRALGAQTADRAAAIARDGQRMAIASRVDAQSPQDRRLLALLSLFAREACVRMLAVALTVPEADVLDSLARLLRKGLVRIGEQGWATSHDMVTEVVNAGLDAADRGGRHADLARALDSEDDVALLAHHLRESGDLRGAVGAYARAARRALDGFADDEALQFAAAGLVLAPPPHIEAGLRETRGEAQHRHGDIVGARQDLQAAASLYAEGPNKARVLARLALLALGADDIVRASQLAELAVAEARDDALARAGALEVASVLDMNLDHAARSAQRAAEALALYERLGDSAGMARVMDARAMATFMDGDVKNGGDGLRHVADLFEASGDLIRVLTPRSTAGHARVFGGAAEEGLPFIDSALHLARTLGHAEGQAFALWHRAEALAALDQGDDARADAEESLAIATRIGHRGWTATAWRAVGIAAQARGDLDAALRAFRESLALSDHLALFAAWAAARSALVLVAADRADEALPLVERALRENSPLAMHEVRWARAEVAAARGDADTHVLAQDALDAMEAAGVRQGAERLQELLG